VIAAAAAAGVTVFDTARAYQGNERLLAGALRACGAAERARVVTKGGLSRRSDGAWVPDGRAKAIRADCEASLEALDGLPIDLYLLHAPDPRTPWRRSLRALARLAEEGLVRRVGVSNVDRRRLDDALAVAPIAAVQVELSPFDDRALRGGVLDRCDELGLAGAANSGLVGCLSSVQRRLRLGSSPLTETQQIPDKPRHLVLRRRCPFASGPPSWRREPGPACPSACSPDPGGRRLD
jgi:aryl-alcohol dehydrogenase-like predicted oxidoreductase